MQWSDYLACRVRGIDPQHCISVGMVVPACNPSSQKDRESRELEGSLSYKKPYFKIKKGQLQKFPLCTML